MCYNIVNIVFITFSPRAFNIVIVLEVFFYLRHFNIDYFTLHYITLQLRHTNSQTLYWTDAGRV